MRYKPHTLVKRGPGSGDPSFLLFKHVVALGVGMTTRRFDVIVELEDLAEWFDNPKLSPLVVVELAPGLPRVTPGFLLRCISQAMERVV